MSRSSRPWRPTEAHRECASVSWSLKKWVTRPGGTLYPSAAALVPLRSLRLSCVLLHCAACPRGQSLNEPLDCQLTVSHLFCPIFSSMRKFSEPVPAPTQASAGGSFHAPGRGNFHTPGRGNFHAPGGRKFSLAGQKVFTPRGRREEVFTRRRGGRNEEVFTRRREEVFTRRRGGRKFSRPAARAEEVFAPREEVFAAARTFSDREPRRTVRKFSGQIVSIFLGL